MPVITKGFTDGKTLQKIVDYDAVFNGIIINYLMYEHDMLNHRK